MGGLVLSHDSLRGHCEAGSLTGAVHLSNDNAGQSILPNQQTAGGDMNTFSEDRNCFLWVVSVVILSISLVFLERLLSVASL